MQSMFKDNRGREDAPEYKIINDRPVNFSEGLHQIDYSSVDKKPRAPDFKMREETEVKEKFFEVPLCVHNKMMCSLDTRREKSKNFD